MGVEEDVRARRHSGNALNYVPATVKNDTSHIVCSTDITKFM